MFLVLYAGSVVVGSYGLVNGITTLSFGLVIATLQLIMQLKTPLNSISNYFAVYSEMLVSIERLLSVTCEKFNKTTEYNGDFTKLEVNNLSFSYGDKEVLKNVSLSINKGDKVLIKGESGEGKSTLLKLISGVIDSSCVNAICGNEKLKTTSVKNLISYVAEENMLFSGTVKDNVLLGLNKLDSEVENALKICCCDFVFDAPNGLDFMVQEGGSNLSIGQGQRLSIARAVVTGAPILVLDEATSGLDEKTEQQLLSNLNKIEGLTIIFVSHKNCFSKFANAKYVLVDGKLLPFAD
jgi:ATP-binding cassette subfamily B protein